MLNPELSTTYTREMWIQDAYDKNGSEPARNSRIYTVRRVDHYCKKIHGMTPEDIFSWMKQKAKTQEDLTKLAIAFLTKYVKFCKVDHKDIKINRGRPNENGKHSPKYVKKGGNYLKKLHDNSIVIMVSQTRVFMSQVGGIRLHNDDMKRVPLPNIMRKGQYDDEDAEPLTAEQSRNVINRTRDHKSIVLYHFMNDTAFRISEAGCVTDNDFDLSDNPPTVKIPRNSIKGVKTKGVRYLRDSTARLIKTLFTKSNSFTFRHTNNQSVKSFRQVELKKIKHVYDSLGMTQVYEDTGRRKYNLHSWRKRCGTEYGRTNTESMADGYLRHSKYLAQYHLKTKDERIEAFRMAIIDLAIDEVEKTKLENQKKSKRISELEEKNQRIDELEKKIEVFDMVTKATSKAVKLGYITLEDTPDGGFTMRMTDKSKDRRTI